MFKSISLATIAAFIALMLIVGAISYGAGSGRPFLSVEGLIIVVGGTIANALLSYPREDVWKAFRTIRDMLEKPLSGRGELDEDIMQIIRWSYLVQAEDFLGLEKDVVRQTDEPFLRYGIDLVVTAYAPEKIREMLQTVAEAEYDRGTQPVTVLRNMAAAAPAFGMIGTLIGMVTILHNAVGDFTGIESGLAIAMLSTLYGLLAARLICLPAADKLLLKEEEELSRRYMIAEGLVLLSEKQKPMYVQDKMNSFLRPSQHIGFNNYVHLAARQQFSSVKVA